MRKKLLDLLRGAAGRLLLRRMLESSAVMAAAGGLTAAAVELGWWLASHSRLGGAAACGPAIILGVWLWTRGALRRAMRLDMGQGAVAGGVCIFGASAGAVGALVGWADVTPLWAVPAGLLCAGAVVGALLAVVRGVSVLQAAVYLDIHGRMDERLATAAEAAVRGADDPLAERLYAQAVYALGATQPRSVPAWKRTRATFGALALAVLLCVAIGFLPSPADERRPGPTSLGDLPDALADMHESEIRLVVATLQDRAGQTGLPKGLAAALRESARAVESEDDQRIRKAVAKLIEALDAGDPDAMGRIKQAILASAGGGGGGTSGQVTTAPSTGAGSDQTLTSVAKTGGAAVRVYDPEYAAALLRMHKGPQTGGVPPVAAGNRVAMDLVWRQAHNDAAAALASGRVPGEYRHIVRNFFDMEP